MRLLTIILTISLVLTNSVVVAKVNVADKVKQGINHYKEGNFKAASEAFAEAETAAPKNQRIIFDLACAKRAEGELDKSIELFQRAAQSIDQELAVKCRYNLAQIDIDKAKVLLGKLPEDAKPEVRKEVIELCSLAARHLKDCLEIDPNSANARHNLETIRLWTKNIQEIWKERDRQKLRDSMRLPQYLSWLDKQQRKIRTETKALADKTDSPMQRQAVYNTSTSQRDLAKEIGPLKEKVSKSLGQPTKLLHSPNQAASTGAPVQTLPNAADTETVLTVFGQLIDEAGDAMLVAAEQIDEQSIEDALKSQSETVEGVDQVATALTPYPNLVQNAVKKQQSRVDSTAGLVQQSPEHSQESSKAPPTKQTEEERPENLKEAAWEQKFVERWSRIMVAKAKQGLKQFKETPPGVASHSREAAISPGKSPPGSPAASGVSDGSIENPAAEPNLSIPKMKGSADKKNFPDKTTAEVARKQQEGLEKSMQKAVKLGPKVITLTAEAAKLLEKDSPLQAMPKQKEALRLLKEISKPLQQQNKNSQKNEEQKKDQDKKKAQNDKDKQNQNKPEQQKKKKQKTGAKPKDISKKQAEALMRKVSQRQREAKKAKKAMLLKLDHPDKIDKDW